MMDIVIALLFGAAAVVLTALWWQAKREYWR